MYPFFTLLWRSFNYKRFYKSKARVISIGNLTFGGSGKTPMVIKLCQILKNKNYRCAVLTRGYKRKSKKEFLLTYEKFISQNIKISEIGDEPALILKKTKCLVGISKNRAKLAKKIDNLVDYIILDDGFQYPFIKKDYEFLIFDTEDIQNKILSFIIWRDFFNMWKKADVIIINYKIEEKFEFEEFLNLKKIFKNKKVYAIFYKIKRIYNKYKEELKIEELKKFNNIGIISGIAKNNQFRKFLESFGLKIEKHYKFKDHYFYSKKDIEKISLNHPLVLTTEKDFIKMENIYPDNIFAVEIDVKAFGQTFENLFQ